VTSPPAIRPLAPEDLFRPSDPEKFTFRTTEELPELAEIFGQQRAVDAVHFGIGIRRQGFNLFLLGPAGTGKYTATRTLVDQQAATEPAPDDWAYVNNFKSPEMPRALFLPPGRGAALREDVRKLIENLRSALPSAFESENYRARKHVIEQEIKDRQEKAFEELQKKASEENIAVLRTPTGLILAPLQDGEVISPDKFEQLPPEEHQRIETRMGELQKQMREVLLQAPKWEQEGRERIKKLNHEVATYAIGHLIEEVRNKYLDLPQAVSLLEELQQDVTENVDEFLTPPEHPLTALIGGALVNAPKGLGFFRRYQVNLLVDHSANHGAPVIYEDHPTYPNLVGQVEYVAQMGALSTDFTLIRPGALHRANGGYLILDAYQLLLQPYAWDALKRALLSSQIRIESLGEMLGLVSTVSLKPEKVPLNMKVILVGERQLYYLLSALDPQFSELFKVAADFDEETGRSTETELRFAQLIGSMARRDGLLPFDRGGVARVIEQSSRVAGDSEKISTHRRSLADLLRESDYWARRSARVNITAEDVEQAVQAKIHREDRIRERLLEETLRGTLLIDTQGEHVGQINGLSVMQLADFSFGHPTRITARVRLGKGEVIDIEREVELGGPIHSKGVLILSAFLGGRYASDDPLSLSASLVFEQSYSAVEGDSASSAELYALLSALSGLPIRQWLAVTGSVNQHGQVQAIGGVNQKIEGFFDLCRARGPLDGQGVLIPKSNVRHLMLRQDVVEAARAGKFHIYPVETIDQGIEILTGVPAGERGADGKFPESSVNQKVEARLMQLAEKRIAAQKTPPEAGS